MSSRFLQVKRLRLLSLPMSTRITGSMSRTSKKLVSAVTLLLPACGTDTRGPVLLDVSNDTTVAPTESNANASCTACQNLVLLMNRWKDSQQNDLDARTSYTDECPENQIVTKYRDTLLD